MNTKTNLPPECPSRVVTSCINDRPGYQTAITPALHRSDNQDEIMELWEAIQMLSKRLDALDGGQDRENKH
jgi:hypothetical protein